jgi:glycosyltransferase involved in cell wall biosynthesis
MIKGPYIQFTRIPFIKNDQNEIFCDHLWAKDLKLHLDYINEFGICCPVIQNNDTEGLINITGYAINPIFPLKFDYGLKSVLYNILPNFLVVIRACNYAKIVHSGAGGLAFPLYFYFIFHRPFISFKWIMLIESSFWMMEKSDKKTIRKIIEHYIHIIILKPCVKLADIRIFTQSFYRKYFLGNQTNCTMINPATWVDEEYILTPEAVNNKYIKRKKNLSIIYPSRLIEDKGVLVVLDAIKKLKNMDVEVSITIMGSGDFEEECKHYSNIELGKININFLPTVDYGNEFFKILAQYDFVLVPLLKQEQPRIIFDAFSQGVAIIGSNTEGILDITNKDNSLIFQKGDSTSLAEIIYFAAKNPDIAHTMGLSALYYVSGKTHLQMHKNRQKFLEGLLAAI